MEAEPVISVRNVKQINQNKMSNSNAQGLDGVQVYWIK